jgi:riboflavin biosynthesis pyrimidine reductase
MTRRLPFPLSARLLAREHRKPGIFHAGPAGEKGRELERRGARLFTIGRGAHVLRSFLSQGLAQQAVVTICPIALCGLRVLEREAGGEDLPDMVERISERHGRDTVVWGRLQSP